MGNSKFRDGKTLPLIEDFYTLQGEGYHTGKAAYFIRIGGCDICCSWCDTKVSWQADIHNVAKVDDIVEKAASFPAKAVVITGGEPLSYDLDYICRQMKERGVATFLETSGAHHFSGNWDWICLSPKQQKPPQDIIYEKAHELKVVIQTEEDFLWAKQCAKKVSGNCFLYLQPEWSQHKIMIPRIVEFIKENPKWCISIQAHKFMRIP